jgi:hypothetical protein
MFIREKKNKSGSISIQIIKKHKGKYKVIETIGCTKEEIEKELLILKAKKRLKELEPTLFDTIKIKDENEEILGKKIQHLNIKNDTIVSIGGELIFGKILKDINCEEYFKKINIKNSKKRYSYFKDLIISRILYQGSKLYLIDYLQIFKNKKISVYSVYRLLDKIYNTKLKDYLEECVFNHTLKVLNNKLIVTFYDVTTLHFESESEDDLRRIGFSKEGKLNRPQIQLGLLTTIQGYPLGYEIFEGNKFEGHTLIQSLKVFENKFDLKSKPIIVADRGMLNDCNLIELDNNGYKYIIGAKLKALKTDMKKEIISIKFTSDSDTKQIILKDDILTCNNKSTKIKSSRTISQRLILAYSTKRAKKDKYSRQKALKELEYKITNHPNLTKSDIKSPYKKYLDLNIGCKATFTINKEKLKIDEKLDGIKGFITNDFTLSHSEIIEHYINLHFIEKAFRISKTDLKIRPIYHRLENRIKAHILLSFIAYAVYKEFERRLSLNNVKFNFSQKIIFDLIKDMKAIEKDDSFKIFKFNSYQEKIYEAVFNT